MKKLLSILFVMCGVYNYAGADNLNHPCDDGPVGRDCRTVTFRLSPDVKTQDVLVGPFTRTTRDHYDVTCNRTDRRSTSQQTMIYYRSPKTGTWIFIPSVLGYEGKLESRQMDSAPLNTLDKENFGILLTAERIETRGNPKDPIEITCNIRQWNKKTK